MADVEITAGSISKEYVAYLLTNDILAHENPPKRDRKLVLDLYAECLQTIHGPGGRLQRAAGNR